MCPPGSFLFYAIAKNSELLLTPFTTNVHVVFALLTLQSLMVQIIDTLIVSIIGSHHFKLSKYFLSVSVELLMHRSS